ncbi:MAG: dihydropyrimidinase [Bacteroidales bacterium]|nr:dihydropyrimidinase [Bacteroidales bacterium]
MDILIKNGTVVTASETIKSDVLLVGNKISHIANNIPATKNCKIIDAEEKYVIPGGIDPHVHMQLPTPAGPSADDFYTGSIAALFGGTTTLIDFVTPSKTQSLVLALNERKKEAEKAICDYSFHVSPISWTSNTEQEIKDCIKSGITSFKVYLAYKNSVGLDYDNLYKVMKVVGNAGGLVTIHCEDGDKVDELRDKYASENKLSPLYHAKSRPAELEALAVQKSIELAAKANCAIYIVHVSSRLSLEHISKAQQSGQKVYAETCPHYLLLDESRYEGEFEKTAAFVISPPLRKIEDQNALWEALSNGTIQTVGTDHCPFNFKQKAAGENDFRKIPNGAGGIEHRLSLLYSFGVLQNKISLNKWVDLCSTSPAKIFGLYPAKGEVQVGADADIVIWNPKPEKTISVKNHHQNCDLDIFEGYETKGIAETVIAKGVIKIDNGNLINKDFGKFIARG